MNYITNKGEGNCGVYAVLHALYGKDADTSDLNIQLVRDRIVNLVKNFFLLREQILSKNTNLQTVLTLYKKIFDEDGWENFKFVALYEIDNRLKQSDNNHDTQNSLEEKKNFIQNLDNWEALLDNSNTNITEEIIRLFSTFSIDIDSIFRDHSPDLDIDIKAYIDKASKNGAWLNNHELSLYLLSQGYLMINSEVLEDNVENGASQAGTIIKFKDKNNNVIALHNNGKDTAKKTIPTNDSDTVSKGTHWQGIHEGLNETQVKDKMDKETNSDEDSSDFQQNSIIPTQVEPRLTPEGLKYSLHGNLYQLGLLTITAYKASQKKGKLFRLHTEAKEHEKFDDLVIDYGKTIIFLQAKHSSKDANYKKTDLKSADGDASLAKYYDSWLRLQESQYVKEKKTKYVFFTNKGIHDNEGFFKDYVGDDEDEFLFKSKKSKTKIFKKGDTRNEFIDAIIKYSEEIKKNNDQNQNIKPEDFTDEIQAAAEYLDENSKKTEIFLSRVKKLSSKAISLIQLAKTDKNLKAAIINKMNHKPGDEFFTTVIKENKKLNPRSFLSNSIEKTKIHQFLDEFIIKIYQPNQQELETLIKKEIDIDETLEIGAKEFYDSLNGYMLKWFADSTNCTINGESFDKWLDSQKGNIHRFFLLGSTSAFVQNHEGNYSDLKLSGQHSKKLFDFLNNGQQKPIFILRGPGVKAKIFQTIQKLKKDKTDLKIDKWAFLDSEFTHFEKLPKILKGTSIEFFILDCRELNSQIDLSSLITEKTSVKWILILSKYKTVNEQLKNLKLNEESVDSTLKISSIKPEELNKIISSDDQEKYIDLAGNYIKISKILSSENGMSSQMGNLDLLPSILQQTTDEQKSQSNHLPHNIYIANNLIKGKPSYELKSIITRSDAELFIIKIPSEDRNSKGVEEYCENSFNYTDKEGKKNSQFCIEKHSQNTPGKNIKYILIKNLDSRKKYQNKKLLYIDESEQENSYDIKDGLYLSIINSEYYVTIDKNPCSFALPSANKYDFSDKSSDENSNTKKDKNDLRLDDENDLRSDILKNPNFSILSALAGHGKTAFCLDICSRSLDEYKWVVYINLPKIPYNDKLNLSSILTKKSTNLSWEAWQIKALEQDMCQDNKVLLVLDSFDEIKNENAIEAVNNWIKSIPKSASILITTRPYAAHKISSPSERVLDNYFTLRKYTQDQRQEYIKQYLDSIITSPESDQIDSLVKEIDDLIKSDKVKSLLGIPLESYLFCSLLEPHLKHNNISELKIESIFEGHNEITSSIIYQKFIFAKLQLFLSKQMKISLESVMQMPHKIYALTDGYNKIMQVFSFKQAFSLEYEFINKALARTYYTREMINDLKEYGLLSLNITENQYYLNFHHETYQEYFTAVFLLNEITLNDEISKTVTDNVIKNIYDPKYRLILSIAAQISLIKDPLISSFSSNGTKHTIEFWKMLSSGGDYLRAATKKLFAYCLKEFSKEKVEKLKIILAKEPQLNEFIKYINFNENNSKNDDEGKSQKNIELISPITTRDENESEKENLPDDTLEIEYDLIDKEKVLEETQKLLQTYKSESIARLFEKIIDTNYMHNYLKLNHYWDIDGGFEAMSLLGNSFSQKMADYFIERIKNDYSWRAEPAFNSLSKLFDNSCLEPMHVLSFIINIIYINNLGSLKHELLIQIENKSTTILEKLNKLLIEQQIRNYDNNFALQITRNLEEQINIFKSIILISLKKPFAVIIEDDFNKIKLVNDSIIEIDFEKDTIVHKFFQEISRILLKFLYKKEKKESELFYYKNLNLLKKISESTLKEAKKYIVIQSIKKESFSKFFKSVKDKAEDLLNLYKKLSEYELVTKYSVEKYTKELKIHKAITTEDNWSINGGIQIAGYTGIYFNQEIANYLISRAKLDIDDKEKALEVLKKIHDTLMNSNVDKSQKVYSIALKAYTQCKESFDKLELNESEKKNLPNDTSEIEKILIEKEEVVRQTKILLQTYKQESIARLFEKIIDENLMSNRYWDIDGGFEAMSLLGNSFSQKMADYFIKKIVNDYSWRAERAFNSLSKLFDNSCLEPIHVYSCIIITGFYHCSGKPYTATDLLNKIQNNSTVILEKLKNILIKNLDSFVLEPQVSFTTNIVNPIITKLEDQINIFKTIILTALRKPFAVVNEEYFDKIKLVSDSIIEINFEKNNIVHKLFKAISEITIKKANEFLQKEEEKMPRDLKMQMPRDLFNYKINQTEIESSIIKEVEKHILAQLQNKDYFNKFFEKIKEKGDVVLIFYKKLSEYGFITEHHIDKYKAELTTTNWRNEITDIAGYTGIFFDKEIANYLIQYANYSKRLEEALEKIHSTLTDQNLDKSQEAYSTAVNSYNECIKNFPELKPIKLNEPSDEDQPIIIDTPNDNPSSSAFSEENEVEMIGE